MTMIFGADYYPEQWTPADYDDDIRLMKDMGLSSVRLAEFAWALMEPRQGKYDFSFFERIIDRLGEAGISVILGTPTATFPPWLAKKYPDIHQELNGVRRGIGTRRQACFASANYRRASEKIVTAMAKKFGQHPNVIAWQIDNEIGHEGSDIDHSDASLKAFRLWLKRKYKRIDELNQRWGASFWGIVYNSFDEIPMPGRHVQSGFNPSMRLDFFRFHSDTVLDYVKMQTKILRKHSPGRELTTNLYPSPFLPVIDMAALAQELDYMAWDNYPVWGDMEEPYPHPLVSYMHEYVRGLRNQSFTVMEQICGFQGHEVLGYLPGPGQTALWTNHAIAHGASSIYYFRFRTARFGQEQLCYGLLDHDKEPTKRSIELGDAINKMQAVADDFVNEDPPARAVLVHDIDNARNLKIQPISKGLKFSPVPYVDVGYDIEIGTWFSGLNILNVNTHVRPSSQVDLSQYKLALLPLYWIADPEFVHHVEAFVRNGGTLVLGYRAGLKNTDGWMCDTQVPGLFSEMAGVRVRQFEAVGEQKVKLKFRALPGSGTKICELLEPTTAEVVARYTDRRKFYRGAPAITRNQYGHGTVYYMGTSLTPISNMLFYRRVLREVGIPFRFLGTEIERVERKGRNQDYEILMNHSGKTKFAGLKRLKPYETRITPKPRGTYG
jgi:beta-galactosidase